jgi:hypothetical protein
MIHMMPLPLPFPLLTLTLPLLDTEAGQGVGWLAEPLFPAVSLGTGVALLLQGGVFTMYQPEE